MRMYGIIVIHQLYQAKSGKQNECKKTIKMKHDAISESLEESYLLYYIRINFEQKKVLNDSNVLKLSDITKVRVV